MDPISSALETLCTAVREYELWEDRAWRAFSDVHRALEMARDVLAAGSSVEDRTKLINEISTVLEPSRRVFCARPASVRFRSQQPDREPSAIQAPPAKLPSCSELHQ